MTVGAPDGPSRAQYRNLQTALLGLLPIAIFEVSRMGDLERAAAAQRAVDGIAGRADGMLFPGGAKGGRRGGRTARREGTSVLAEVARGMAVLAHNPGGVTSLGIHACAIAHSGCPAGDKPSPVHPAFGRAVVVDDEQEGNTE